MSKSVQIYALTGERSRIMRKTAGALGWKLVNQRNCTERYLPAVLSLAPPPTQVFQVL